MSMANAARKIARAQELLKEASDEMAAAAAALPPTDVEVPEPTEEDLAIMRKRFRRFGRGA